MFMAYSLTKFKKPSSIFFIIYSHKLYIARKSLKGQLNQQDRKERFTTVYVKRSHEMWAVFT